MLLNIIRYYKICIGVILKQQGKTMNIPLVYTSDERSWNYRGIKRDSIRYYKYEVINEEL